MFYNINSNPLIRTDEIYPGADGRLQEIVDKATQKNPDKRYQNCEEMLEKISVFLGSYNNAFLYAFIANRFLSFKLK